MIRPRLVVVNHDRDEQPRSFRDSGKYHFDLSLNKLVLYGLSLVLSLCFMFILGVFVGRGTPMVKSGDFSIKGKFLRFLGLDQQTVRPNAEAAATWKDPRKMLESLNYYQDLTRKGGTPLEAGRRAAGSLPAAHVAIPAKEAERPVPPPQPVEKRSVPQPEKPRSGGVAAGRYTLLVASMKEPEAQVLVKKLKTRGYSPRIESMDIGAGKWSRVLLGSFASRQAAIAFADEFNSKEKLGALVVSSSD